jgi:hypothetical protein
MNGNCVDCGASIEIIGPRNRCDTCRVEYRRTYERERSKRRRATPTEIRCTDCGRKVVGDRRRERCAPCAKKRGRDQQRARRGTPNSFKCERCNNVFPVKASGNAASTKWCDQCRSIVRNEQATARYAANPDKYREAAKDWYRRDLEKNRRRARINQAKRRAEPETREHDRHRRRARQYGITVEEVIVIDGMLGKPCPICASTLGSAKGLDQLCIDHDHETGVVRGVLCSSCNTALGMFEDDPERLRAAARFISG